MKRILGVLGVVVSVLAFATVVSFAQQPEPAPDGNVMIKRAIVGQGPETGVPKDFIFVASEVNFSGKVVKGSPYSAQAVTETIQTLGDGNRIVNRVASSLYRDSEGRTRREQTIKMLGPLGEGGEPLQTIFINDPVAGVTFALDSRSHVAHKSTPFKLGQLPPGAGPGAVITSMALPPGAEGQKFEFRVEGPGAGGAMKAPPAGLPPGSPDGGPEVHDFQLQTEQSGGATFVFRRKGPADNEVTEQLGKQSIEGVEAEGTRTTVTIPAGEIGNDRAIEIVSERWYSPELQMVVMTRHSDPRSGETTYRLTNINRTEPAKSFFEVPADYTVKEGFAGGVIAAPQPARVRKPE
jgi:hypothetical protein